MHLISWNPSNRSQFAHLSPALQLEIFDIIEENDARTLSLTDIIPSDHVNCFEWQYSNQNSLLAYGTTTGAVTVVNRALSTQTLLPSSTLKRPCHQIAWNYGQTNKLSAGFESIKSNDSCILIFDLESQKSLKLPSNESCCSLNWLPQHDCLIFSGNSMGWIKLFDLRCAAPVLSWHSHPANRPRKVKGISPCLLDGNIVASYSDAVGDTVKIWDLRLIEGKAVKKGSLPRGFSVNPYHYSHDEYNNNIVTSACINDISWSPSRTDLLAVATSNSRSILFFKYDNGKMETQNLETKFPVSVVHTVEPVKSLSWHLADSDNLQISRPSIIESINRTLDKQLEITSLPVKWDDFLLESVHYTSSLIREPQNQQIQTPHNPEAPVNKKLLALTSISLVETDVREAAPFTFSEQRLVVQSQKGVKIFDLFPSKEEAKLLNTNTTFEDIESYLADITSVMKDRAMSGYSFDAPANLDIFSEEIDSLNNKIADLYKHGANVDRKQLNIEKTFQRVHEVHRVWVWIDRVETSTRFTKLSLQNCGVLPAFSVQTVPSEVTVDASTGAQIFSSETRSQIRKVSGWLNINEHSQDAEQESLGGSDLLDHFIDDCESICFERAAMLALWHGNLDLAVDVLHGATSSPDTGLNSDDEYSQIIALVASCIAGYHVQHPNQAQNRWSHGNETRVRASWKTTCNLAIRKLKTFEQFTVSYLLAGCQFLLANAEKSSPESFLDYEFLLKDEHIYLEDKIAFAATYLNDQQLQRWMTSSYNDSLKNGNLEGLMFTGLNKDGLALLQGYLDSTSDIQSVALITSRILCGGGLSSTPIPPNHQSKIVDSDLQMTEKVTKWINSYRQLLTRWELYNERAHLDIEISQKIQKTHEYRQKFAVAAPTNAGRARGGRVEKISLPVYEGVSQHLNFHYIKIKCSFCGQSLPADDIATNRMETLRTQNNLINCCSNCNKQLPRCYVCKLYVGVSNPYLKVKQAALMRSSNTNPDASSNKSNAVSSTTTPNAKGKHPSGAQNSLHQNTKSIDCAFDQWLLFCQRCRHGGHTVCLSKWFTAGTENISSLAKETSDVSIQRIAGKGQVCGVNGCDCECKIIL